MKQYTKYKQHTYMQEYELQQYSKKYIFQMEQINISDRIQNNNLELTPRVRGSDNSLVSNTGNSHLSKRFIGNSLIEDIKNNQKKGQYVISYNFDKNSTKGITRNIFIGWDQQPKKPTKKSNPTKNQVLADKTPVRNRMLMMNKVIAEDEQKQNCCQETQKPKYIKQDQKSNHLGQDRSCGCCRRIKQTSLYSKTMDKNQQKNTFIPALNNNILCRNNSLNKCKCIKNPIQKTARKSQQQNIKDYKSNKKNDDDEGHTSGNKIKLPHFSNTKQKIIHINKNPSQTQKNTENKPSYRKGRTIEYQNIQSKNNKNNQNDQKESINKKYPLTQKKSKDNKKQQNININTIKQKSKQKQIFNTTDSLLWRSDKQQQDERKKQKQGDKQSESKNQLFGDYGADTLKLIEQLEKMESDGYTQGLNTGQDHDKSASILNRSELDKNGTKQQRKKDQGQDQIKLLTSKYERQVPQQPPEIIKKQPKNNPTKIDQRSQRQSSTQKKQPKLQKIQQEQQKKQHIQEQKQKNEANKKNSFNKNPNINENKSKEKEPKIDTKIDANKRETKIDQKQKQKQAKQQKIHPKLVQKQKNIKSAYKPIQKIIKVQEPPKKEISPNKIEDNEQQNKNQIDKDKDKNMILPITHRNKKDNQSTNKNKLKDSKIKNKNQPKISKKQQIAKLNNDEEQNVEKQPQKAKNNENVQQTKNEQKIQNKQQNNKIKNQSDAIKQIQKSGKKIVEKQISTPIIDNIQEQQNIPNQKSVTIINEEQIRHSQNLDISKNANISIQNQVQNLNSAKSQRSHVLNKSSSKNQHAKSTNSVTKPISNKNNVQKNGGEQNKNDKKSSSFMKNSNKNVKVESEKFKQKSKQKLKSKQQLNEKQKQNEKQNDKSKPIENINQQQKQQSMTQKPEQLQNKTSKQPKQLQTKKSPRQLNLKSKQINVQIEQKKFHRNTPSSKNMRQRSKKQLQKKDKYHNKIDNKVFNYQVSEIQKKLQQGEVSKNKKDSGLGLTSNIVSYHQKANPQTQKQSNEEPAKNSAIGKSSSRNKINNINEKGKNTADKSRTNLQKQQRKSINSIKSKTNLPQTASKKQQKSENKQDIPIIVNSKTKDPITTSPKKTPQKSKQQKTSSPKNLNPQNTKRTQNKPQQTQYADTDSQLENTLNIQNSIAPKQITCISKKNSLNLSQNKNPSTKSLRENSKQSTPRPIKIKYYQNTAVQSQDKLNLDISKIDASVGNSQKKIDIMLKKDFISPKKMSITKNKIQKNTLENEQTCQNQPPKNAEDLVSFGNISCSPKLQPTHKQSFLTVDQKQKQKLNNTDFPQTDQPNKQRQLNKSNIIIKNQSKSRSQYTRAPILSYIYGDQKKLLEKQLTSYNKSSQLCPFNFNQNTQQYQDQQQDAITKAVKIVLSIDPWLIDRIIQPYSTKQGKNQIWLYCKGCWKNFLNDSAISAGVFIRETIYRAMMKQYKQYDCNKFGIEEIIRMLTGLRVMQLKNKKKLSEELQYHIKKGNIIKGISLQSGRKIYGVTGMQITAQNNKLIKIQANINQNQQDSNNDNILWIRQETFKKYFDYFLLICYREQSYWTYKNIKQIHNADTLVYTLDTIKNSIGSLQIHCKHPLHCKLDMYRQIKPRVLKFIGGISQKNNPQRNIDNPNSGICFNFNIRGRYYLLLRFTEIEKWEDMHLSIQSNQQVELKYLQAIQGRTLKNKNSQYIEIANKKTKSMHMDMNKSKQNSFSSDKRNVSKQDIREKFINYLIGQKQRQNQKYKTVL